MPLPLLIPLIGALAGAGGSIFSSILGADAQEQSNEMNWMINLYNAQQRNKERQQTIDYAEKVRGEEKLGGTDASGNRTYFKEGEGWVTELGKKDKELEDYFYSQELPERRGQFKRKAEASRGNADEANQLLAEFQRIKKENPQDVENLLYSVATKGIGDAMNETVAPAMTAAVRTGNRAAVGDVTREANRAAMKQRADAALQAKIQSLDYADQKYNSQRSNTGQLYNLFSQLAGQDIGASMQPGQGPQAGNALLQQFAQLAQGSGGTVVNAMGRPGGTLGEFEPRTGPANMWGGIGNALAGLGDRAGSMMERQDNNEMLKNYITQGGQLSLDNGGLGALITDRVRAGGNVF